MLRVFCEQHTATACPASATNTGQRRKEGRKEMFYLTTHSTPFYLGLYGVRHMVNDISDSERGNPLPPHGLLFPISSKGSVCVHHPTDMIAHTTAFVTPVVEHWPERDIAQLVLYEGSIRQSIAP